MKQKIKLKSGLEVYYWEYNPSVSQAIIMIHGFRGTHHGMLKIVEALGKEYRLVVPDLPGFGESKPFKGGHNIDDYVEFLREFREMVEPSKESSIILGHSFGSIVVGYFAAKYPKNISRMILVNPICSPALEGPKKIMTGLATAYYKFGEIMPEGIARQWLSFKPITKIMSLVMRKTKDRDLQIYIDQQHYSHFSQFANSSQLMDAYKTSIENDVSKVADKIIVPTLLIAGDQDDIVPLEKAKELQKKIPGSKLFILENVGHLSHYETPERVASAILKFV